jgi:deoxyribodipyrimidine photo-lyase
MTANRRLSWNYALDRSLELASELGLPLLILEALSVGYPWSSARHHRAVLDGMAEHRQTLQGSPIAYYPYVEPEPRAGSGLLQTLASHAAAVVTDDSPTFFTPTLVEAAARLRGCVVEAVDSCGLWPIRATDRTFSAAVHFRRFLQRELPRQLGDVPEAQPLEGIQTCSLGSLPEGIVVRWPAADPVLLDGGGLGDLPVDRSVHAAARAQLNRFLRDGLPRYADERNHPDADAVSHLSPWLHYGHISSHEVFHSVARMEGWSLVRLSERADGRRRGWWGMSESAEAFLDQFIVWRELGFGFCTHRPDYAAYESLPEWAQTTLEDHAEDPREHVYTLEKFESTATHDPLWNASQRQLVEEGVMPGYLRMLWGKKILEWAESPREAFRIMIELNNRYALDGRDPNSYSGIAWVMGRFDRGWPERPVYGKVRSMSSASARRKLDLEGYVRRWSA